MTDDQYGMAAIRPACNVQQLRRIRSWRQFGQRYEFSPESVCRFLRARGWANQDLYAIGQVAFEPNCHCRSLLAAFAGKTPPNIGLAFIFNGSSVRMTPEDEIHGPQDSYKL